MYTPGLNGHLRHFAVRRRDGIPAYQLASLADDLHFGITHVIRGQDLQDSTIAQQFLAECLDKQAFTQVKFLHHPLLLDEKGQKLSKSAGADSLRSMREKGLDVSAVCQVVARLLEVGKCATAADLLARVREEMFRKNSDI